MLYVGQSQVTGAHWGGEALDGASYKLGESTAVESDRTGEFIFLGLKETTTADEHRRKKNSGKYQEHVVKDESR